MEKRSKYFKDFAVKPMDLATFWIEFVIKYKGAPHLNNPGLHLRWFQYYFVDLAMSVLLVFVLIITLFILFKRTKTQIKQKKS